MSDFGDKPSSSQRHRTVSAGPRVGSRTRLEWDRGRRATPAGAGPGLVPELDEHPGQRGALRHGGDRQDDLGDERVPAAPVPGREHALEDRESGVGDEDAERSEQRPELALLPVPERMTRIGGPLASVHRGESQHKPRGAAQTWVRRRRAGSRQRCRSWVRLPGSHASRSITAGGPPAVTDPDTWRDQGKTTRRAAFPLRAGRFPQVADAGRHAPGRSEHTTHRL